MGSNPDFATYSNIKSAIKTAAELVSQGHARKQEPIILIDYHNWDVIVFEEKSEAEKHLEKYAEWDDSPPDGDDEELILIKYCGGHDKREYPNLYKNYQFYKSLNGVDIYREKSFVSFEPELIINIYV
ncbi:hypothetical protein [Sporosarcina sp. FSL K6-3457]|uniref:hypothetical protein n=1 Tax=Sporosarcina sp. FSL K6-3457 TaxID=2978204 RepID=UPI0030F6F289